MSRRVEELLWLLRRVELKEELHYTILNVDTLIYLFARYLLVVDNYMATKAAFS